MCLRLAIVLAVGLAAAGSVSAADHQDSTEQLINKLFNTEVQIEGNVNDMTLLEMFNQLSKNYGITFRFNEESTKVDGMAYLHEKEPNLAAAKIQEVGFQQFIARKLAVYLQETKPNLTSTSLKGMNLHQFITLVLETCNATYLVKGNIIEIAAIPYVAKITKSQTSPFDGDHVTLVEPLVCAIIKQKSLANSVELLASRYNLSISFTPQAGESASALVSARLLNLPADKAIEMLALQCDLRVVRKGTAYLITTREYAKALQAELLEEEKNKIEIKKLRTSASRKEAQQDGELKTVPKGSPAIPQKP